MGYTVGTDPLGQNEPMPPELRKTIEIIISSNEKFMKGSEVGWGLGKEGKENYRRCVEENQKILQDSIAQAKYDYYWGFGDFSHDTGNTGSNSLTMDYDRNKDYSSDAPPLRYGIKPHKRTLFDRILSGVVYGTGGAVLGAGVGFVGGAVLGGIFDAITMDIGPGVSRGAVGGSIIGAGIGAYKGFINAYR